MSRSPINDSLIILLEDLVHAVEVGDEEQILLKVKITNLILSIYEL